MKFESSNIKPSSTPHAPAREDRDDAAPKKLPYEAPKIVSSGIFHTVSNGPTPQLGCSGYG